MLSSGDIETKPSLTFPLNLSRNLIIKITPNGVNAVYVKLLASVWYADIKQVSGQLESW